MENWFNSQELPKFFCANSLYNKTTTQHKTIFTENNKCALGNQHCSFLNNKQINIIKSVSTAITEALDNNPQLVQKKNLVLSTNAAKYIEASILPKKHTE